MTITKTSALRVAKDFINFVDRSPSPYHAVHQCKLRLLAAGFKELKETERDWNIKPMDKIFITKDQSSIVACALGGKWEPGNGFTMLGAHTDSPCPRIKKISKREKEGFLQVGVECYGGGNWLSWFDRDLKLAGRLIYQDGDDRIVSKLVDIDRPLMRIPHVAIHLLRGMNEKFSVNKEKDLIPVIGTAIKKELTEKKDEKKDENTLETNHHGVLMELLSNEIGVESASLIDFDLFLADYQKSTVAGISNDFIFAPRIDNLLNMYTGLCGLIESCQDGHLDCDTNLRMLVGYDNEEVGSRSSQGAGSSFTEYIMRRLSSNNQNLTAFEESISKSMLLSADNGHGIHPNYSDKLESKMKPSLQGGPILSTSGNQNFATNAITASIIRQLAQKVQLPIQDCMGRNDIPSGSTIGPVLSTKLGIKTADVGASQLSMHSCREMCGIMSPEQCIKLYTSYFQYYPEINSKFVLE